MIPTATCSDCQKRGQLGYGVVLSAIFEVALCVECWVTRYRAKK